jgi:hypothetical protein
MTRTPWPGLGQSDLSPKLGVSRASVGHVVSKARERWLKTDSLADLREAIASEVLRAKAGVATHEELISDLLLLRGSALPDPERRSMASIVTRAAMEAERHLPQPRFQEFRRRGKSFLALRSELIDFALAQNGLFGSRELSVEELRERVAGRYHEAQPLPDRPALDALLEGIGLPLRWSAEARNGQGAYVARGSAASDSERTPSLQRARTIISPLPRKQLSEEVAEALRLEEKLRYAEKQGSFLVLAVPPRHLQRAEQER